MEKNKRRKLLILPLFLSFILLMMTSYAWFSANRVVSVESLDVHVQADGGLEVSTDSSNWKQVITVQDIANAKNTYPSSVNQIPEMMYPVSTGGNISNGFLEMFKGSATNSHSTNFVLVADKSTETSSVGAESAGNFIAFDLFFRVKSNKDLYVSSNSNVKYVGEEHSGIENATRVAFLNEGVTSGTSGQSLKNATSALIWEPNYDTHTEFGVTNAQSVYGLNTSTTGGSLLPYYGVISDISEGNNVLLSNANSNAYPNLFKKVDVALKTTKNNTTNVKLLQLTPSITKIRIYMWIEGQDVDCEDNAAYGDLSFSLEFTTNPA
jgi:hypothetical protein